ncbi:MAG TPA: hypothetical protein VFK52_10855 [Nocardioidaceae bacterium]|nr:hypothetical protein [Nocardioidaceae bacterium]
MSNLAAAQTGSHRQALERLRDTLASRLDEADAAVAAQIAGQYRSVLADIAALDRSVPASVQDELKAKRRERRTQQRKAASR